MSARTYAIVGGVVATVVAAVAVYTLFIDKPKAEDTKPEAETTPAPDAAPAVEQPDLKKTLRAPIINANSTSFDTLMDHYDVPVAGERVMPVGGTGYLDQPFKGEFFHGIAIDGRRYINLPLIINKGTEGERETAIVLFQRYTNQDDVWVKGGSVPGVYLNDIAGRYHNDFDQLRTLLAGDPITLDAEFSGSVTLSLKR